MKKAFILCGILCAAAATLAGCGGLERSGDSTGGTTSIAQEQQLVPSADAPEPDAKSQRSEINSELSTPAAQHNQAPTAESNPVVSGTPKAAPAKKAEEKTKAAPVEIKRTQVSSDNRLKKEQLQEKQFKETESKEVRANNQRSQEKASSKPVKKERQEKPSMPVQQHRLSHKALTLAQLRQKYGANFKMSGSADEKKVALTFDDGPDEKYTAQVLDALKAHHVKATFFVLGVRARQHPELIARMVKEGHVVGNHSYSHANLPKLSEPNFERQVETTQSILKPMLGYEPKLFRPPYGAINEEQVRWAAEHEYMIVNWNVDSLDWKGLAAEKVVTNIISTAKAGSIILQHCGGGPSQDLSGTVKALPAVIQELKSQGYQFVTIPELLHIAKSK